MDIDTIKAALKEQKLKQNALAKLLGLADNKITKTFKGERQWQDGELETVCKFLGLAMPDPTPKEHRIYYRGEVSAGIWREAVEQVSDYIPSPDRRLSRDAFALRVVGDSMNLVAHDGAVVIVEPQDKDLVDGKFYVIRNSDGEATFKQYRESPSRLEPVSSNANHKAIFPGREPFEIVGRVRKRVYDM